MHDILWTLTHPEYMRPMMYEYCALWDASFNKLMDTHKFEPVDRYTARLGCITIWISNHPYASWHPYGGVLPNTIRPSRRTMARAKKKFWSEVGA